MAMRKVPIHVVGLSYSSTQTGAYALVLGETGGKRRLPIIIGSFEAQAIAMKMENVNASRPLTHDLFLAFADSFGIRVKEVIIYNLQEGVFHSKIVCDDGLKEVELDSRTSDAIAIALRFDCPIYTYEFILSSAGIVMDDSAGEGEESPAENSGTESEEADTPQQASDMPESYETIPMAELESELRRAIAEEAYERASRIQKEIDRRKSN